MIVVKRSSRKVEQKSSALEDLKTSTTGEDYMHKSYATGHVLVLPKELVMYNRVETYFSDNT